MAPDFHCPMAWTLPLFPGPPVPTPQPGTIPERPPPHFPDFWLLSLLQKTLPPTIARLLPNWGLRPFPPGLLPGPCQSSATLTPDPHQRDLSLSLHFVGPCLIEIPHHHHHCHHDPSCCRPDSDLESSMRNPPLPNPTPVTPESDKEPTGLGSSAASASHFAL